MDGNERRIVGITMLSHAVVHVFELSIPIFIPIWLDVFGLTAAQIGLVVGIGYAVYGLGAIPSGLLVDRFGARTLLIVCAGGMALSFFAVSFASGWFVLVLALVAWGAAASLYHPSGLAVISTDVDQRGTALGYHGIAGNVGIAVGPLATLFLLLFFDWRIVAAILASLAAIAVPVIFFVEFEETTGEAKANRGEATANGGEGEPDRRSRAKIPFHQARLLFAGGFAIVFVLYVLEGLYYRGILTFLPELLGGFDVFDPITVLDETVDPSQYIYSGLLLVGVIGQYASGKLSDRFRPEYGLVGAFAGLSILALLFVPAVEAGVGPLLVVCGLLGLFLFGLQPFMQASVAEHTPPAVRGLSFGVVFAGLFGVGAAGAAITGAILTYSTTTVLFVVLGAIAALALPIGIVLIKRF